MTISSSVIDQTDQCFKNIAAALSQAGASLSDVVRVHYLITRRDDFEPIWPVLQKYFGEVRPACTVIVTGLLDEKMLIEIEVTAVKAA
jgi:enamine deaminase RidA (YjgF/YER057c/UK114 family)